MRGKMLIFLALLCLMLAGAGWMYQQTNLIQGEIALLEAEIELLEAENAHLRVRVQELQLLREIVLERMDEWLEEWEVDVWEATAYAPLDSRAKEGMCYSGDPRITASGAEVIPGVTAATAPGIPFGTRIYICGHGPRIIQDRGGRIGPGKIDLAVESRGKAITWGRKTVKVVYQK